MSNNPGVQSAFPFVVFGAVGLSVVMSVVFLLSRESVHDQIGQGGLTRDSEGDFSGAPPALAPDSPEGRAEREREIRQMLNARSERRVRAGQPALDVDAEVARLLAPPETGRARRGPHRRRFASWSSPATNGAPGRASSPSMWRPRWCVRWRSWTSEHAAAQSGINAP